MITSTDGQLNLDRALPETVAQRGGMAAAAPAPTAAQKQLLAAVERAEAERIHTVVELEELERQNILRALEAAGGRISGAGGAAGLLGMKPSTLRSRMKALGLKNGATP